MLKKNSNVTSQKVLLAQLKKKKVDIAKTVISILISHFYWLQGRNFFHHFFYLSLKWHIWSCEEEILPAANRTPNHHVKGMIEWW